MFRATLRAMMAPHLQNKTCTISFADREEKLVSDGPFMTEGYFVSKLMQEGVERIDFCFSVQTIETAPADTQKNDNAQISKTAQIRAHIFHKSKMLYFDFADPANPTPEELDFVVFMEAVASMIETNI